MRLLVNANGFASLACPACVHRPCSLVRPDLESVSSPCQSKFRSFRSSSTGTSAFTTIRALAGYAGWSRISSRILEPRRRLPNSPKGRRVLTSRLAHPGRQLLDVPRQTSARRVCADVTPTWDDAWAPESNPLAPSRYARKSCHSRPNIGPMAQRKKMACQLSLASH